MARISHKTTLEKLPLTKGEVRSMCDFISLLEELNLQREEVEEYRNSYYHKTAHDMLGYFANKFAHINKGSFDELRESLNAAPNFRYDMVRVYKIDKSLPEHKVFCERLFICFDNAKQHLRVALNNLSNEKIR